MDQVEAAVIGAGAVGLAVAAELAAGHEVVVLEKHPSFGRETSSRNSEVIHAGIYYEPGSLKARLCVEGRELLYKFCRDTGVPHAMLGKLIAAKDESELPVLADLAARAAANGAGELPILDRNELRRLEPNLKAAAAVFSPRTGIVDSHQFMKKLHDLARRRGAVLAFGSEVIAVEYSGGGFTLTIEPGDYAVHAKAVINCGGLWADRIAAMAGIDIDRAGYRLAYWKGSYFAYHGASPVSRLVYPIPHDDLRGLGVHATLDLSGRLRFGPDAEPVAQPEYDVDESKADEFYRLGSSLIEGLQPGRLKADMAGVRPKPAGETGRDFIIRHEADRGLPGLINLVGIESPGLTAALAIARLVARMAGEILAG